MNKQNNDKKWTVYEHIFPNNKRYVGITSNSINTRWQNGMGYKNQLVGKAIMEFGWNNIEHKILFTNLSQLEAESKERFLIKYYKTQDRNFGYNIEKGGIIKHKIKQNIKLNMGLFRKMKNERQPVKSEYAILCTIFLFKTYHNYKSNFGCTFTLKELYNSVMGNDISKELQTKIRTSLKSGLEELKQKNWINYNQNGRYYTITESYIFDDSDNKKFMQIPMIYINKILTQKNGIKLLQHYLYLVSTINIKQNVGFASCQTIAENLDINISTVSQRNKKLEELEVIKFNSRKGRDSNNNFINMSNIYYLPEDSIQAESYKETSIKNKEKEVNKEIRDLVDNKYDYNPF